MPRVDGHGGTTQSPFFPSKAVMCSRQTPNLGCFGPKETFTTKSYTSENKWAFILEGNPARLFIICTTIIKLVLISIAECCWVSQLAALVAWVETTSPLRRRDGKQGDVLLLKHFSQDPYLFCFVFFCFLVWSLQLQSRLLFSFSFPLFSFLKIPGDFQKKKKKTYCNISFLNWWKSRSRSKKVYNGFPLVTWRISKLRENGRQRLKKQVLFFKLNKEIMWFKPAASLLPGFIPWNDLVNTATRGLRASGMAWVSNILYHDQIRCRVMCPDLGFGLRKFPYQRVRMWLVLSFRKLPRKSSERIELTENFSLALKTLGCSLCGTCHFTELRRSCRGPGFLAHRSGQSCWHS